MGDTKFKSNTGNYAFGSGGAIYAGSGTKVEIHTSSFISNEAGSNGGGAIFVTRAAKVEIHTSSFVSNQATGVLGGGAIYAYDGSFVHIESSQFVKGADPSATH